jgi:hypothetical protein
MSMSTGANPLSDDAAKALLDLAGVTLPPEELTRFAQTAGVMRVLAGSIPAAADLGDEPATIFDPLRASKA